MLKKLTELEVTADSPFANDALERKGAIEKLTNLIESTEQPFVLSIEAPWGWGKTTFTRMWKAHLESKDQVCLHFNAWENDFVDDPLVTGNWRIISGARWRQCNTAATSKAFPTQRLCAALGRRRKTNCWGRSRMR